MGRWPSRDAPARCERPRRSARDVGQARFQNVDRAAVDGSVGRARPRAARHRLRRILAFSHMHFDHVGNANLFTRATWILHRDELAWALADPPHVSMVPELFSGYTSANKKLIDGDFDVFGAGTVRILKAPATRRAAPHCSSSCRRQVLSCSKRIPRGCPRRRTASSDVRCAVGRSGLERVPALA